MLKRSMILLLVLAMLVSFSAAVLAEDKTTTDEGQAPNNKAGVKILVEDDGETVNEFLDAVNDSGKENGKPTNPITVAGK